MAGSDPIHSCTLYLLVAHIIYPLNLLIPSSLGKVTTILGIQFLILFLIFKRSKELNFLLFITLVVISLHYFMVAGSSV